MDENKIKILTTLYSQQQSTAHILRERMSRIAAATISLFLGIDGWVLQGPRPLNPRNPLV